MHAKKLLSTRLKDLRGAITIKDLAQKTGLSHTVLYKTEDSEESVAWKTIEAAYGDLCQHHAQYEELLMLWAMTQSKRPVSLYKAREALNTVMDEEAKNISKEGAMALQEMEMMGAVEQRNFTKFAKHFRLSEHTRKMAEIWMECSAAWVKEMTGA